MRGEASDITTLIQIDAIDYPLNASVHAGKLKQQISSFGWSRNHLEDLKRQMALLHLHKFYFRSLGWDLRISRPHLFSAAAAAQVHRLYLENDGPNGSSSEKNK